MNRRLLNSELELNMIVEQSFLGYTIIQDGRIVFANPAYVTMVGRSTENLLAMTIDEVKSMIHPADREAFEEHISQIIAGLEKSVRHRFRYVRPDGTCRYVESFIRRLEYRGQPALQILEIDITDQKEIELEQVAHQLVCLRNVTMLFSQPKGTLQDVLSSFVHLIPEGWQYPAITCARVIFQDQIIQSVNFTETKWKQSADIITANGKVGSLEVYYIDEMPTMEEGPFLKQERSFIETLAIEAAQFIDGMILDEVREQQQRELEIYARFLRHDLTNDLGVIIGNIDIARMLIETTDSTLHDAFTSIEAVCDRMANLLKAFGRQTKIIETDITILVTEIASIAQKAHVGLTVNVKTNDEDMKLRVSESRLLPLVFENLFRNAAVYAGESPTVDVVISREGNFAKIIVSDDGPGIHEDVRERLFERGVSTSGGGLGLYLSRQVVEGLNGTIMLAQTDGKGATFDIRLPLAIDLQQTSQSMVNVSQ